MKKQSHRRVRADLHDYALGRLSPERTRNVELHLVECAVCRERVGILRAVKAALAEGGSATEHPSSDSLARLVVDPESLDFRDREEIESHVGHCPSCRSDLEDCRLAIGSARPRTWPRPGWAPEASPARQQGRRRLAALALAAVLVLGVGLVLWWLPGSSAQHQLAIDEIGSQPGGEPERSESIETTPERRSSASVRTTERATGAVRDREVQRPATLEGGVGRAPEREPDRVAFGQSLTPAEVSTLAGRDLRGIAIIEASERIDASATEIEGGTKVTLRSATVTMGDGFIVHENASLVVVTTIEAPGTQS